VRERGIRPRFGAFGATPPNRHENAAEIPSPPRTWQSCPFVGILESVRLRLALVVLVLLGAAGCESYVHRGSALYADGRYIEAAEVFERTEQRLPESTPRERAEYGLYRGMTLLVLGDLPNARRWMSYAYDVERAFPGSLRSDRRAMLDRGWFEVGQRMKSELELAGQPPQSAIASSQPSPPAGPEPGVRSIQSQQSLAPR
jgi:hypothetical protein